MLIENILDSKAMEELTTRLNNDHIDVGRFMDLVGKELASADENKITNKRRWLEAVIERLLKENKESLKRKNRVVTCEPLFNDMRANGIVVEPNDTLYLDIFFTYLVTNNKLTIEEIREVNHEIMKYVISHGLKSSNNFIELFKRSKAIRGKEIDYNIIQSTYEKAKKELEEFAKELGYVMQIPNYWEK